MYVGLSHFSNQSEIENSQDNTFFLTFWACPGGGVLAQTYNQRNWNNKANAFRVKKINWKSCPPPLLCIRSSFQKYVFITKMKDFSKKMHYFIDLGQPQRKFIF